MTRSARKPRPPKARRDTEAKEGSSGFLGQLGLFETANGWPHGPFALILAVALALIVLPLRRLARWVTRD